MVGHRAAWSRAADILDEMQAIEDELRDPDAVPVGTARRTEMEDRFRQLEKELRASIAELGPEAGGTGSWGRVRDRT